MEIPSLITLSLSALCQRQTPEERPKMRRALKGMFDKHNYSAIFRVFDEMDYCFLCDNWASRFREQIPGKETYHMLVAHSNLKSKEDCDCNTCKSVKCHLRTPRTILCVRCKETFHYGDWGYFEFYIGYNCNVDPRPSNKEPYLLGGGYWSDFDGYTFSLTHRAPLYLVEWTRAIANEKDVIYSQIRNLSGQQRKRRQPIRRGHSLCNHCVDEMLLMGQLQYYYHPFDSYFFFNPAYCEGCEQGFRSNQAIQTIVIRQKDSAFRFCDDYIVSRDISEWAFFRYQHYDRKELLTVYVPKYLDGSISKYLEDRVLICNDCFNQIESRLECIHSKERGD